MLAVLPVSVGAQADQEAAIKPPGKFAGISGRAVCDGVNGYVKSPSAVRTFLWRPEWLAAEKLAIANSPKQADALRKAAEKALANNPYTVTAKLKTPASGSKNDYYSIGPYWWPTPGKRGGEPYFRKDGRVNPERSGEEFDRERLRNFSRDVRNLSLAYHYLGNKEYAEKAGQMIRVWFLDPETRMNPNLDHAQAIPGKVTGRGEGIIDMIEIVPVVEAIGLLGPAKILSDEEQAGLEQWFADMVNWMATSPNGRQERAKINNHGIHYDYFMVQFSLFARLEPVALHIAQNFPAKRIAVQMAEDGRLPDELKRTRSWHYSFFALNAATGLAGMSECVGVDLWNYALDDGRGLKMAFEFLAPYQGKLADFPFKDIAIGDPKKENEANRIAMETTRMMAWGTGDKKYEELASRYNVESNASSDFWLSRLPVN